MININDITKHFESDSEITDIIKAYEYAKNVHLNQVRLTGEDFISHPLEVANILTDLTLDKDTIMAAILHEVIAVGNITYEEVNNEFGTKIADVIKSVTKINKLEIHDSTESERIYFRKVLVGMAKDVSVIYIKLADRLHNMRTNFATNELKQKEKASETLNIMVPIAHRLGMNKVKSELENLSLLYLKPDVYNDIEEKLKSSQEELKVNLDNMIKNLSEILSQNNMKFEIKGRVKSVYSIYNKLTTGRSWDDIYDILALRIFVESEEACFEAVSYIHSKYKPFAKRFKDYVTKPKDNMYQSLHTSIVDDSGNIFEIQIRTKEMDIIAEKGIASHWSYKEKGSKKIQNMMEQKLEMFRNIIEHSTDITDEDFEKNIKAEFLKSTIYVYTPKGDVVELPVGASPIDFAYRIHSRVGETLNGAIVNDVMVSFDYELKDGDIVKVMTNATSKPNVNWLNIAKTTHAKNKIKAYFSHELKEEYINKGRSLIEKELRRRKLSFDCALNDENTNKILKDLKLSNEEELYLSIGTLRYTPGFIINLTTENKDDVPDLMVSKIHRKNKLNNYESAILVDGKSNVLVNIAKCCEPVLGDDIIGFITKTHGVSIHKKTCENVNLFDDKIVEVMWSNQPDVKYNKKIYLLVSESDIKKEILEVSTKQKVSMNNYKILDIKDKVIVEVEIGVTSLDALSVYKKGLNHLPKVLAVSEDLNSL